MLRGLASRCRVLLFLSAAGFTPLILRSLLAKAMLRRTAVPRLASARAGRLSLMVRKLVTVLEDATARSWLIRVLMGLGALSTVLGGRLRLRSILLLCILLHLPILLILQSKIKSCIFVQVKIEGLLAACEVFVSLRYVRTVLLNLLDLL